MTNTQLLVRLRELHENLVTINDGLQSIEQVDEETINELGQLVTDVSDLIDKSAESSEASGFEHDQLLKSIDQFQCEHVRVKSFLAQVKNMLTTMEI